MTIDSAIEIIHRWESTAYREGFIFRDRREEIDPYLQAVDEIQRIIGSAGTEDDRKEAKSVMRIAASRLAQEFRYILKVHAKISYHTYTTVATDESTSSFLNHDSYMDSSTMTDSVSNDYEVYEDDYLNHDISSTDMINDLRSIVVRMNSSGFLHECLKVYIGERQFIIGHCFQQLKREKLSGYSCRRLEWAVLKPKIEMLIKALILCFRYNFVNEKQTCEQIFHDLGDETTNSCFMATITDHVVLLLDTAEAICCIPPASERLFKILDLYDTLSDLLPFIDNLFNSQSSDLLRSRVTNHIIPKLADKAREILLNFEKSLVNERSPVVHAEPIHQLLKYVMDYVSKLCDHKKTFLTLSLPDLPATDAAKIEYSSFSVHVNWIIMRLVTNIEIKSKLFKEPSARWFFAMNSFNYINKEIHAHQNLLGIISNDNFINVSDKFIHARSEYLKLTFKVPLRNLKDEGQNNIKILFFRVLIFPCRLKRFNHEFEKLRKNLGNLLVPDYQLMLELRRLIDEMMVTTYASFLLHIKKVPRYSVEEIESAIRNFFVGKPDR